MFDNVYDFKEFYNTPYGSSFKNIIGEKLSELWPNLSGMSCIGYGYACPYNHFFSDQKNLEMFYCMPASMGVHRFPEIGLNVTFLSEESEIPIETNSIDRVLVIHGIEFSELPSACLQELWRILKSNGRIILVAPNRLSMWSRTEWSPLGYGTPYSHPQLCSKLKDALFSPIRSHTAIFSAPFKPALSWSYSQRMEKLGKTLFPALGGVHIIEAEKQIYSPIKTSPLAAKIQIRGRRVELPSPVTSRTFNQSKL